MITPIAPAIWAFFALRTNVQFPRSMSATCPVRLDVIGEHASVAEPESAAAIGPTTFGLWSGGPNSAEPIV